MTRTVNRMKMPDTFKLMKLVEAEYVSSKKSDAKFAEHAAKTLGVIVTTYNVEAARESQGIPANHALEGRGGSGKMRAMEQRIVALEVRQGALEARLESHIAALGG